MRTQLSKDSVVGIYETVAEARAAVERLRRQGHPADQISLVAHDLDERYDLHEYVEHGDRAEQDAAVGGAVGGIVGLLAGAAFFWVPGVGPLVVLGPVATGMTGSAVGALVGAMAGWGISQDQVGEYEQQLQAGRLLVIAYGSPDEVAGAKRILAETGPRAVHLHAETSADSKEIDDR